MDALALILHRNSNLAFHLTVCSCTSSLKRKKNVWIHCITHGYNRRKVRLHFHLLQSRRGWHWNANEFRCWLARSRNKGIKRNSGSTMIHSFVGHCLDLASSHRDLPTNRLNEYSEYFASGKGPSAQRPRRSHVSNRTKGWIACCHCYASRYESHYKYE